MPRPCSTISAYSALTSRGTRPARRSQPKWPWTTQRRSTRVTLLEPTLVSLPLGQAFLKSAGPVFDSYGRGDHAGAFAMFASAASGLEWEECRALLEQRIPGVVAQSIKDADTFFGVELPSLLVWAFGPEQAAAIHRPVLSVLGAETQPLWVEIAELPPLLPPVHRGVHDRRRGSSPADPAPRASRSSDGGVHAAEPYGQQPAPTTPRHKWDSSPSSLQAHDQA